MLLGTDILIYLFFISTDKNLSYGTLSVNLIVECLIMLWNVSDADKKTVSIF
jgi:hypothetical protein